MSSDGSKPVVAVTGAGGFIGSHLTGFLADAGHRVHAIVRRAPAAPVSGVRYFHCSDISCIDEWSQALEGVDVVVHLVARVHMMKQTRSDAGEYHRVNLEACSGLARACVDHAVKRLIYVSTIKVNGETTGVRPFTAEDVPSSTHEAYARTKREAEEVLFDIGGNSRLQVVVIRPPLVYGPCVKGNFLQMMRVVKRQWPLPFASVENCRSLVSVFNLCDLIGVCLVHPAAAGEVFLVSDGEDVSTPGLLRLLAAEMQCRLRLFHCPVAFLRLAGKMFGQSDKIDRLCGDLRVDMGKTQRQLNWKPPLSLAEGIRRTLDAFH